MAVGIRRHSKEITRNQRLETSFGVLLKLASHGHNELNR